MQYNFGVFTFNKYLVEITLLFTLVVHAFRAGIDVNQSTILVIAFLILVFTAVTWFAMNRPNYYRLRIACLILILALVHIFLLIDRIGNRTTNKVSVHDGVIMTEAASKALLSGENPYSVNYRGVLYQEKYPQSVTLRSELNYPYSPGMILMNIPFFWLTDNLFGIVDVRIFFLSLFLLSAFVGALMIREKILFFVIFLLNPLFVPLLYYGANDTLVLFFFVLIAYFLRAKKLVWSTVALGLISATKLLYLPLVPLYFIYMFLGSKGNKFERLINQLTIFVLVNLAIYLPFLIWSPNDLIKSVFLNWLGVGEGSYPVAGYLGIAQILTSFGLVSPQTSFPFFLLAVPFEIIFLFIAYKMIRKSPSLQTLSVLFAFNLILVLLFSRLVQTYYLAFISQILLLATFLGDIKLTRRV